MMGKPAFVSFCGLLALAVLVRGPALAEPPAGPTFTPGAFFDAEDYEWLADALSYAGLEPSDLTFEKKHLEHRYILPAVADALDNPLGMPRQAEQARDRFGVRATWTDRFTHAADLLNVGTDRWARDELLADAWLDHRYYNEDQMRLYKERLRLIDLGKPMDAPEFKALEAESEALETAWLARVDALTFGGEPEDIVPTAASDAFFSSARLSTPHFRGWRAKVQRVLSPPAQALSRYGQALEPRQAEQLAAAMPPNLFSGHTPLSDATPPANWPIVAERVDTAALLVTANRLAGALESFGRTVQLRAELKLMQGVDLTGDPDHGIEGIQGGLLAAWQSPWGLCVIGGSGPNVYERDDIFALIDVGGDDIYRGRFASGIGLPGHAPISFVLDLGGNDRFEGEDFTQGFGFNGIGVLMTLGEGDDTFIARHAAQGAGMGGVGILYSDGGNDRFEGDSFVQGAGMFGYGHLINEHGNDQYRAARFAQGFAQVMGVGVLTDGGGNDLFYAGGKYLHEPLFNDRYQSLSQGFAIGNRRGLETGGGVGVLLAQGDGNDVFHADIYGQGAAYWYALGILVSEGGNDTFTLGQYGQGAGIHLAAGILVNLAGNDTYTNVHGVGTGGAHDWSVGWLIDRAGNDLYQGNGQGQGLNYSVGILYDRGGNDAHSSANPGSIGRGTNNDISLLLNLAGDNRYTDPDIKPGQFTRRGRHGLVYDPPEGWFPGLDARTLPTPQDPAPERVTVEHILVSWEGLGVTLKEPRTRDEAQGLAQAVLRQARTRGTDWRALQREYNEDTAPHIRYDVFEGAALIQPFKEMSLSLGVGQIDVTESRFGFHIIRRVE
jgi:hypothetical protein